MQYSVTRTMHIKLCSGHDPKTSAALLLHYITEKLSRSRSRVTIRTVRVGISVTRNDIIYCRNMQEWTRSYSSVATSIPSCPNNYVWNNSAVKAPSRIWFQLQITCCQYAVLTDSSLL